MTSQVVRFRPSKSRINDDAPLQEKLIAAMRTVYDPEITVNVYDLGLIYDIAVQGGEVRIKMTLTAPGCPVAGILPKMVEKAVKEIAQVESVKVELVWDPPWTQDRMSDEAKLELGLL